MPNSKKFKTIFNKVHNDLSNGFGNSESNLEIDYDADPRIEESVTALLMSCAYGLSVIIEEHHARMARGKRK